MKVAFVEPKPPFNAYYFLDKLPLLGNLFMASLLRQAGHDARVIKEQITLAYREGRDSLHPFIREAQVVGITAVTHTIYRAFQIADAVKRQFPEKKVVMGGSHPSARPQEALQHADQVVVGEGEELIRPLVEGELQEELLYGSRPELDSLPILDLEVLEGIRGRRGSYRLPLAPLMTSRGCPHNCVFCSVTKMFGRRVRFRDPDLVVAEMRRRFREGFRRGFFYDDNFAADYDQAKVLLEKIIRAELPFNWSSQFSVHAANDPELLSMLRRARCTTLFIGLESVNPRTLKEFRKAQTVRHIERSVQAIREAGLGVHGMFMLGGETDDEQTIDRTVRFALDSGCETAQFSVLFPIPGTELYGTMRDQGRLLFDRWDYYDGSHVVFSPRAISPLRLQKGVLRAYTRFYSTSLPRWLASRLGVGMWHLHNRRYMRRLRAVERLYRRGGGSSEGVRGSAAG
jgi:radical SAM superfamily enzyme YgiQ (UPF0313 family)